MKGMTTCKVCGRDFPLMAEEHYIARDPQKTGALANLVSTDIAAEYDAFDCPHCGCQNLMQIRKPVLFEEIECDCGGDCTDEETSESHDGCDGCRYEELSESDEPCKSCKNNYTDNYEGEEDDE